MRKISGSVPTTPTHDTTASGDPTTLSKDASFLDNRSALFQSTFVVHSWPAHHLGTVPDFDMLVTEAPLSTRLLQTRDPAKPLPPNTVTDNEEPGDKMESNSMAVAEIIIEGNVMVADTEGKVYHGPSRY
jgi:hypothetical protein